MWCGGGGQIYGDAAHETAPLTAPLQLRAHHRSAPPAHASTHQPQSEKKTCFPVLLSASRMSAYCAKAAWWSVGALQLSSFTYETAHSLTYVAASIAS